MLAPAELILMTALVVLGGIVGLTTFRNTVIAEYVDIGNALENINQSYSFTIGTATSEYVDSVATTVDPDFTVIATIE